MQSCRVAHRLAVFLVVALLTCGLGDQKYNLTDRTVNDPFDAKQPQSGAFECSHEGLAI